MNKQKTSPIATITEHWTRKGGRWVVKSAESHSIFEFDDTSEMLAQKMNAFHYAQDLLDKGKCLVVVFKPTGGAPNGTRLRRLFENGYLVEELK